LRISGCLHHVPEGGWVNSFDVTLIAYGAICFQIIYPEVKNELLDCIITKLMVD